MQGQRQLHGAGRTELARVDGLGSSRNKSGEEGEGTHGSKSPSGED